jgi:hypothetical protein
MFRTRSIARGLVLVGFAFGGRISASAQNPPGTPRVIYPSASAVSSRLSDLRGKTLPARNSEEQLFPNGLSEVRSFCCSWVSYKEIPRLAGGRIFFQAAGSNARRHTMLPFSYSAQTRASDPSKTYK